MTPEQLRQDQSYLFTDFPTETVVIGTQSVPCLVPDDRESNEWIDGGLEAQDRAAVVIERSALFVPTRGMTASYRGEVWRVAEVRRDHSNSPLTVHLEKAT